MIHALRRLLCLDAAVLLAAVLVGAQLGLIAHEAHHDLGKPDQNCEVCLHAHLFDKAVPAAAGAAPPTTDFDEVRPFRVTATSGRPVAAFLARAPPLS